MRTKAYFNLFRTLSIAALVLTAANAPLSLASEKPTDEANKIRWAWRKNFSNARLGNLAMAWNGARIVFSVTETAPGTAKGDVIVGVDNDGKVIRDWRINNKKIKKISINGEGKKLLVELDGGALLFYEDWEKEKEPVKIKGPASGAVLSPKGDYILTGISSKGGKPKVLSTSGDLLWSPETPVTNGWKAIFPFFNNENRILLVSKDGEALLSEKEKTVWKAEVKGTPRALASSFLEGDVTAVLSSSEIRFFDGKGAVTGTVPFPSNIGYLSCSDTGNICAASGNNAEGQFISAYSPDGKKLWGATLKGNAKAHSSLFVSAHGETVIAGIKENGSWSLRAWDKKGDLLWTAPVEGGLADFKVSWNGKRIAVLTMDGRTAFFDLK